LGGRPRIWGKKKKRKRLGKKNQIKKKGEWGGANGGRKKERVYHEGNKKKPASKLYLGEGVKRGRAKKANSKSESKEGGPAKLQKTIKTVEGDKGARLSEDDVQGETEKPDVQKDLHQQKRKLKRSSLKKEKVKMASGRRHRTGEGGGMADKRKNSELSSSKGLKTGLEK